VAINVKLPWISREHHTEVVAAKDALIASLEAQNAVLAARLAEPVSVSVQLPENFAMVQPALVRHRKEGAPSPAPRKEAPEVDWANVNADNPFIMAELAAQEFGRMLSPIELADWTRRVRRQIQSSKEQASRTPQIGTIGTLETSLPPRAVPPEILAKIEEAERV
jgi:hypothetical protein